MKHQPLPWERGTASNNIIIKGDYQIQIHCGEGDEDVDADMDFILRAVNSFYGLVEAVEWARQFITHHEMCKKNVGGNSSCDCGAGDTLLELEKALIPTVDKKDRRHI